MEQVLCNLVESSKFVVQRSEATRSKFSSETDSTNRQKKIEVIVLDYKCEGKMTDR